MMNAGFYKFDGDELRYGSTAVYAPNFTLRIEQKDSYQYPVFGWIYANSTEEAEQYFGLNGETQAQWIAFAAAIQQQPAIAELIETAPLILALNLAVGLGKAADGDPRAFAQAWSAARSVPDLVPPELLAGVVALAQQYQLPAEFVGVLGG